MECKQLGSPLAGYLSRKHVAETRKSRVSKLYKDPTLVGPGKVLHRESIWNFLQELNITYPEDDTLSHLRSRFIQKAYNGMCTAGYALSRNGAKKLLYEIMHTPW